MPDRVQRRAFHVLPGGSPSLGLHGEQRKKPAVPRAIGAAGAIAKDEVTRLESKEKSSCDAYSLGISAKRGIQLGKRLH